MTLMTPRTTTRATAADVVPPGTGGTVTSTSSPTRGAGARIR